MIITDKELLILILNKNLIDYNPNIRPTTVYELDKKTLYFYYGDNIAFFEREWYEMQGKVIKGQVTPTSAATGLILLNYGVSAKKFKTKKSKEEYIYVKDIEKYNEKIFEVQKIKQPEEDLIKELQKSYGNFVDEFALKERIETLNIQKMNNLIIQDDDGTDLVISNQVSDPKPGCSQRQGRPHSKQGKTVYGFPTLESWFAIGLWWVNCRHRLKLFYLGLSKIPRIIETKPYENSSRKERMDNSRRIRYFQTRLKIETNPKRKKFYENKIKELKKKPYFKERIY